LQNTLYIQYMRPERQIDWSEVNADWRRS